MLMRGYAALLVAATAALAPAAYAQVPCSDITKNRLTSAGCPSECGNSPCVLYSPLQKDGCIFKNGSAAGGCYNESGFQLTSSSEACDLTYQCLTALVPEGTKKWILALKSIKSVGNTTYAPVTEILRLTYPESTSVTAVQLSGGVSNTPREGIKDVTLDKTFFATRPWVTNFFLSDVNLPTFLKLIDYDTVKWGNVAWNNVNLDAVPAEFAKLDLKIVELRKNYLRVIDDPNVFAQAVSIDLRENFITDITVVFPAVESLLLSRNPLGKVPAVVFQMKSLKKLTMKGCNITNQQFTAEQLTFLNELQTFDADVTITDCGDGFIPTNLTSNSVTVCAPGTAASPASGGTSSNTVIIVLVVAGVVVVLVLGAFLFFRRRKSTRGDHYTSFSKGGTTTNETDFTGMGSDNFGSSGIWNDDDLLAVRIEYRDVEPIKLLSRGGFGEVWLGLYMNENVAIKRLLPEKKTMTDALAFAAEVKTMARLDHPKIVRFIGVAWTNALTIQAVTEFMDCGDLRSLLDSSRASSLTWANLKCQIAIDVADALVYMHTLNPKLIHRDLKSRNVLIDANTGAKLSDFGISRNRSVEETMTAGVGTARWIAPEVILGGHYTEFADIYSFGVVLSELDTNKAPFHDATNTNGAKMQDVTILQLVSAGKLQPSFEKACPEPIVRLARACLAFDPAQRPSAIHISYELRKILKDEL